MQFIITKLLKLISKHKFINNPFVEVIEAAEKIYNIKGKYKIAFTTDLDKTENCYAVTRFCENGEIIIVLDINNSYICVVESLIHELAHVAAGYEADHNEKWQLAYNSIVEKYKELNN